MNKMKLRKMQEVAKVAILNYCKENGLDYDILPKGGQYSSASDWGKFTLEIAGKNDGVVMTKEAGDLKELSIVLGLGSDALGKQFTFQNEVYTLVGYKTRASKYRFLGKHVVSGKTFKFASSVILDALGID